MEKNKPESTEWVEFLSVIVSNIRMILIFVLCSCLAAVVLTYFIPKQYSSNAIIFPTENNSLDDAIRNPQFGYDVEADRLIQLLQSRMIRDSIIRKFDLINYYHLDTSEADWEYRLIKKFDRDISFRKTEFMSVNISAQTRSPKMSADIVNEMIVQAGKAREKLLKSNVYLAVAALQRESLSLKADLDSMAGVLNQVTSKQENIKQFVQTDRYVSLIMDKKQIDDPAGKSLQLMVNQYNVKLSWYYDVQTRLKNAALMSQRPLPAVYTIEQGVPSYKKSYPKYSINLLLAFAGSSVFISFLLFFLQKIRNVRSKLLPV